MPPASNLRSALSLACLATLTTACPNPATEDAGGKAPTQAAARTQPAPEPATAPKAAAPKAATSPAPKAIPAKDVRPPMISRATVVKIERRELPDGRGVWMTAGAPVPATGHYAGDVPAGAAPGEQEMTFTGASEGDYPHLFFEHEGQRFDFGAAKNQVEGSGFDIEDKGPLVGKSFVVKWDFRPTTFACCEGDTTLWVGMKPTILSIRSSAELP